MHSRPRQPELQRATLTLYGELLCRRNGWAGELVFAAFHGAAASGLSAASSLAGAASLIVDADGALVHSSNRDGAFDFVVNTLDEALRALKNEIRRGRPLSVALLADPRTVLRDAEERGLAPHFVLSGPEQVVRAGEVRFQGSRESAVLLEWLKQRSWSAVPILPTQPHMELGRRSYAEDLSEGDLIRQNWLRNLGKYQRSVRQGDRWCWLAPDEASATGSSAPQSAALPIAP